MANVVIIMLLVANLGLSAYTAFRPLPATNAGSPDVAVTTAIKEQEANKIAATVIAEYNAKNIQALYELFDPLAKAQFTKQQFESQMEKLSSVLGHVDNCAYSHATSEGNHNGRDYYVLHYKVGLSGGPFSSGDLTISVSRTPNGLGLFGFFINGTSRGP
jgi:hypothetical protein